MKIVESDTGQKTEQLIGPDLSTGRALVIGREELRRETITSSPPPIVGCDRTVIEDYSLLRAIMAF